MPESYWIETLGCPKNQVDSEKISGSLDADGLTPAKSSDVADVVIINTCAFIDAARQESIDTIEAFLAERREGTRVVVTGCLAARAGEELALAMPEIDVVADVGVPILLSKGPRWRSDPLRAQSHRLMDLPRSKPDLPWAYVKIAEGCDRSCGFCAIPSFRGPQVSRTVESIVSEVVALGVREIVLVAQDLASFGNDRDERGSITELVRSVTRLVDRVRLLYLYPASLTDALIEVILESGVPYFDLSLQHVSPPLVRRMRRYGSAERFLKRIDYIRSLDASAAFRSSFILGYPGETEEDHDRLLEFLEAADLDWVGFFPYSQEEGTYSASLDGQVPRQLALERLRECAELQDAITARKRRELVSTTSMCLVDSPGVARSYREAPEIDGIIRVDDRISAGTMTEMEIVSAEGPDLIGSPIDLELFARVPR